MRCLHAGLVRGRPVAGRRVRLVACDRVTAASVRLHCHGLLVAVLRSHRLNTTPQFSQQSAQLDQKVSNDLVKELKDISPPLADSQGDILVEEVQKAVKKIEEQQKSRK